MDAGVLEIGTPWGPASELRKRKLQPGRGTPRSEVVRNQRERLFGAIVAVVSEKGYEATTVADVIDVCGISRSDFYKHFGNKAECLAATAEALIEPTLQALRDVRPTGAASRPQAVFEEFLALVSSQPAAARVCFVDLHAAGAQGEAVADMGVDAVVDMVNELAPGPPGAPGTSPDITKILLGGVHKVIHTRLCRHQERELTDLAPTLWRWIVSVEPPPRPLDPPRRQRPSAGGGFEGYTPAERIARAVATVVAEKGYGEMSTDDIAARAAISLSTFYANFSDKQDAVLAALEMGGAQMMASAVPAARRASDWQGGVRALYEAMCAYFAAEPALAKLLTVGVYAAGPPALARRDRVIDSLAEMLGPGFDATGEAASAEMPRVSAEAIGATVYALMRDQVRLEGAESLSAVVPMATYITLVGFVGPERAWQVANDDSGRR